MQLFKNETKNINNAIQIKKKTPTTGDIHILYL